MNRRTALCEFYLLHFVSSERSTIGAKLRLSTLYKSYSKWALDEVGAAASRQKLAEALREHGFEDGLEHGVTVFKVIRLHDEEAEPY